MSNIIPGDVYTFGNKLVIPTVNLVRQCVMVSYDNDIVGNISDNSNGNLIYINDKNLRHVSSIDSLKETSQSEGFLSGDLWPTGFGLELGTCRLS